jgi:hypothetical protein
LFLFVTNITIAQTKCNKDANGDGIAGCAEIFAQTLQLMLRSKLTAA